MDSKYTWPNPPLSLSIIMAWNPRTMPNYDVTPLSAQRWGAFARTLRMTLGNFVVLLQDTAPDVLLIIISFLVQGGGGIFNVDDVRVPTFYIRRSLYPRMLLSVHPHLVYSLQFTIDYTLVYRTTQKRVTWKVSLYYTDVQQTSWDRGQDKKIFVVMDSQMGNKLSTWRFCVPAVWVLDSLGHHTDSYSVTIDFSTMILSVTGRRTDWCYQDLLLYANDNISNDIPAHIRMFKDALAWYPSNDCMCDDDDYWCDCSPYNWYSGQLRNPDIWVPLGFVWILFSFNKSLSGFINLVKQFDSNSYTDMLDTFYRRLYMIGFDAGYNSLPYPTLSDDLQSRLDHYSLVDRRSGLYSPFDLLDFNPLLDGFWSGRSKGYLDSYYIDYYHSPKR